MEAKKIEEMTDEEIASEIKLQAEALFRFRFQLATGQLENPSKIKVARRFVTRLKTAQRARELKLSPSA